MCAAVQLLIQCVAWDIVHEEEGTVFVALLDGVVVFGEVGTSHGPHVTEDRLLVPDVLELLAEVLVLRAHSRHLHQEEFLHFPAHALSLRGLLSIISGLIALSLLCYAFHEKWVVGF